MTSDYTELVILLDRSGSMQTGRSDHEGGLRSFIKDQRQLPGDVRLTFVRFDSTEPFELIYDGQPLTGVEESKLELLPRGGTPLLASIMKTIAHVKDRLGKNTQKPDQVLFMIITDGEENSSGLEYKRESVKKAIEECEKSGWKVLYLGANVDAFAEAGGLGIGMAASLGYAAQGVGVGNAYASVSTNMLNARSAIQTQASTGKVDKDSVYANYNFTKEQRTSAKPEDEKTNT